jgi:hypothetical protein
MPNVAGVDRLYNRVIYSTGMPHIIGGISESQIIQTDGLPMLCLPTHHEATMADSVDEQIKAHIHEILRLVRDAKGRNLRELNKLVGETSKLVRQSITKVHAKIKWLKTIMSG